MGWTNEKYLNFIEDYKRCRLLWDVRNPNYTNNNKKRKFLIGLAQKYGMDEASLKKKIKNLRSAFHREHHRLTKKMKGGEHETDEIRKWFAYDALKFILAVSGPLVTKREEQSFSTEDSFQDELVDDQEFNIGTQYIQLPELIQETERSKSPETSRNLFGNKEEDEFDLFGRSMTMQLKKMPELVALDLMQKMQLMVFNAKKQLSRAKNKRKLKLAKPVSRHVQSKTTSKKKIRPASPMSHVSSASSTSPNYKFEAISPESHVGDKDPDFNEYVTAVEPYTEETNEDGESDLVLKGQLKRKSFDPLELKQCKLSNARIKSE